MLRAGAQWMGWLSAIAGVGGTLDVIVTQVITKAYTDTGAVVTAGGNVSILATDSYSLVAVVLTISLSLAAAWSALDS